MTAALRRLIQARNLSALHLQRLKRLRGAANAITLNGEPLTLNGETLTLN